MLKESIKEKVKEDIFKAYICNNLKMLLESSVVGYKDIKSLSEFYDRVDNFEKYKAMEEKTDEEITKEVLSKFRR